MEYAFLSPFNFLDYLKFWYPLIIRKVYPAGLATTGTGQANDIGDPIYSMPGNNRIRS
jgi:hypothetical protein